MTGGMMSWVIYDMSSRGGMGMPLQVALTLQACGGGAKVMLWQLMSGVYMEIKCMQWAYREE